MKNDFNFFLKSWEFSGTFGRVLRFSRIQTLYFTKLVIMSHIASLRAPMLCVFFSKIVDISGFARPVGGIKKKWARLINEIA
jgi:hypothetical protein